MKYPIQVILVLPALLAPSYLITSASPLSENSKTSSGLKQDSLPTGTDSSTSLSPSQNGGFNEVNISRQKKGPPSNVDPDVSRLTGQSNDDSTSDVLSPEGFEMPAEAPSKRLQDEFISPPKVVQKVKLRIQTAALDTSNGKDAAFLNGVGVDRREMSRAKSAILDPRDGQDVGAREAKYGKRLASVGSKFLSVTLDSNQVRKKFSTLDFGSKKLQNMAAALAPANLRLGGTSADFLIFDPDGDETKLPEKDSQENFTMTGNQWSTLTNFTWQVGWDMMFDFNVFLTRPDGLWDSNNAAQFLDYSAARNIPIPAFQLGNEPEMISKFNVSIPGDKMVKNYEILRDLLKRYPLYHNSRLVGPEVASVGRNPGSKVYLNDFLKAGAHKAISTIGIHQYYLNGATAEAEDFLNPKVLDDIKLHIDNARKINKRFPPMLDLELTETSSCYGGGSNPLSRTYIAGFLWLDKLGISAESGVTAVTRQSLSGDLNSLLSLTMKPRPDFFLSVLYKRLVQGSVFQMNVSPKTPCLRVYANCARTDFYKYPTGAVVFYYVNVCSVTEALTLKQFEFNDLELYQLTPGDADGLLSNYVSLNGQKLELSEDDLPSMVGVQHKGDVQLPPQSFGFIVVPKANEPLCGA